MPPDTITDINDTRQQSNEIGLRTSNVTDELLEKQHDMIVGFFSFKKLNHYLIIIFFFR